MTAIVFVDDEPQILSGIRRSLRGKFDVITAGGGEEGLAILAERDDIAVIVSDMRMPVMDGATFLAAAREQRPDSTRMLLTGQADVDAAIAAVNRGQIFRFLTKPCPTEALVAALEQAMRQHELVIAERQLTEGTLRGAIGVLTDVLAMAHPAAHQAGRASAVQVNELVAELGLADAWQFEIAALLSALGSVALPDDVVARMAAGRPLSDKEQRAVSEIPGVGASLLERIPRMADIAEMIRLQQSPLHPDWVQEPWPRDGMGASLLRVANEIEAARRDGLTLAEARRAVLGRRHVHHPAVMDALARLSTNDDDAPQVTRVRLSELTAGATLAEDLRDALGTLLISAGHVVTEPLLARIARLRDLRDLPDKISVAV